MPARCRINFETLTDYCTGNAEPSVQTMLQQHLAQGCPACEESLARLTQMVSDLQEAGRLVSPAFSLEPARALFRERQQSRERRPLFARLVFDSRLTPAAAGVRGGSPQASTRLYRTAHHAIEIWQEPVAAGQWYLIGQALSDRENTRLLPTAAALTQPDGSTLEAVLDGDEFHFPAVTPGLYTLTLNLGDISVAIPEMPVVER